MMPLVIGAIPFGIIFGTLAASSGLSFLGTIAMSAFVFAGSAQFIAIGLLAANTNPLLIIMTTLIVNLRHLLYSVSVVPYVQSLSQGWKAGLGFLLTDEAFVVAITHYQDATSSAYKHWYHLGASVLMYGSWQLWTFLGLTIGHLIPDAANWGLDFAMSATFISMIVPYLKNQPTLVAIMVSGVMSVLTYHLPHQLGLAVAALSGIAAGAWAEQYWFRSHPPI